MIKLLSKYIFKWDMKPKIRNRVKANRKMVKKCHIF